MTARAAISLPSASPTPATRPALRLMSVASRPQVISAPASCAGGAQRLAQPAETARRHAAPRAAKQLKRAAGERRIADPPVENRRQQMGALGGIGGELLHASSSVRVESSSPGQGA